MCGGARAPTVRHRGGPRLYMHGAVRTPQHRRPRLYIHGVHPTPRVHPVRTPQHRRPLGPRSSSLESLNPCPGGQRSHGYNTSGDGTARSESLGSGDGTARSESDAGAGASTVVEHAHTSSASQNEQRENGHFFFNAKKRVDNFQLCVSKFVKRRWLQCF